MQLPELHLWRDSVFRDAASNMALDEALFDWSVSSGLAVARFYHWDQPAVTVGYFHRQKNAGESAPPEPVPVRRYTGGGLVDHGGDLTFVLTFPARSAAALAPGPRRYRWIHETLADALVPAGFKLALERAGAPTAPGPCFTAPVPWDLLDPEDGRKLGGGAQRRARGAVIHQGSLRLPEKWRNPEAEWISRFIDGLAREVKPLDREVREQSLGEAERLTTTKYRSAEWNHRR